MGLDYSNVPWNGRIHADIPMVGVIMVQPMVKATMIMQEVLAQSHNLYEKGDHCVEIDLATLDRVRDFLVKQGLQYHYEAEDWKEYHMVKVTCVECGASKEEPESHDMHFLTDGLCPECDEKAGYP